jgi:chromate reductase
MKEQQFTLLLLVNIMEAKYGLHTKILAFAGSTRKESFNKKLVKIAADAARAAGAQVTYLDLRDIPMPLYDGDLETEQGIPENAKKFKAMLMAHDGFLISAPEYNSSISGVLKNAIDWASRPVPGEAPLVCFAGKVVTLDERLSRSAGRLARLGHCPFTSFQYPCHRPS